MEKAAIVLLNKEKKHILSELSIFQGENFTQKIVANANVENLESIRLMVESIPSTRDHSEKLGQSYFFATKNTTTNHVLEKFELKKY